MFAIEPIYKSTMNGNYVINIGRQLGSGGKEIGEKLAARLGIDFYDKELINLASEESGLCREFFEKADEKASQGIIGGLFGMRLPFISDGAMPCTNCLSNDALFKIQSDVIRHLAANKSCVFVGRCADYILREHPRCANVFISASKEASPILSGWSAESGIAWASWPPCWSILEKRKTRPWLTAF